MEIVGKQKILLRHLTIVTLSETNKCIPYKVLDLIVGWLHLNRFCSRKAGSAQSPPIVNKHLSGFFVVHGDGQHVCHACVDLVMKDRLLRSGSLQPYCRV